MKISIPGTTLSAHLRPLRATVRESEGINYDKTAIAIYDIEQKHHLVAFTSQPSYHVFMDLNLSGDESTAQTAEGQENAEVVARAIDAHAVPCADNEHWMVKNSALLSRNRCVGAEQAEYVLTGNMLDISMNENSILHLEAAHRNSAIEPPSYDEMLDPVCGTPVTAHGCFGKNVLADALAVPNAVCHLSGKSGRAKEHAVHLQMYGSHLRVEALSNTAEVVYDNDRALTMTLTDAEESALHLSISLEAAQVLAEISQRSGLETFWVYSREEKVLTVWCLPYVVIINAEEMNDGNCTDIVCGDHGVSIKRKALEGVLRRAKAAGSSAIRFSCHTTGCVEASADKSVEDRFAGAVSGAFVSAEVVRMPVNALLAVVRSTGCDDVVMTFGEDKASVVFDSREGEMVKISCL